MKQPATKLKAIVKAHKNQKRGLLEYLMLVSRGVSKDTLLRRGNQRSTENCVVPSSRRLEY